MLRRLATIGFFGCLVFLPLTFEVEASSDLIDNELSTSLRNQSEELQTTASTTEKVITTSVSEMKEVVASTTNQVTNSLGSTETIPSIVEDLSEEVNDTSGKSSALLKGKTSKVKEIVSPVETNVTEPVKRKIDATRKELHKTIEKGLTTGKEVTKELKSEMQFEENVIENRQSSNSETKEQKPSAPSLKNEPASKEDNSFTLPIKLMQGKGNESVTSSHHNKYEDNFPDHSHGPTFSVPKGVSISPPTPTSSFGTSSGAMDISKSILYSLLIDERFVNNHWTNTDNRAKNQWIHAPPGKPPQTTPFFNDEIRPL